MIKNTNNKYPTISLFKNKVKESKNNNEIDYIFGYYTKIPWTIDGQWHTDNSAFLFNVIPNKEIFPIIPGNYKHASKHYNCDTKTIFWIGYGGALAVYDNCNKTANSRVSKFSPTFLVSNQLSGYLYRNFIIDEIEVFHIQFNDKVEQ